MAQINDGVTRCPRSFTLTVPNQFRYPVWGTGTWLSYAQTSQTADSETNIHSGILLRSWNKW